MYDQTTRGGKSFPGPPARGRRGGRDTSTPRQMNLGDGDIAMSFIQREIDRVTKVLRSEPLDTLRYKELYAAQQALMWTLDPEGFASPYEVISKIPRSCEIKEPVARGKD